MRQKGFTLIEFLVVIAILAIIAAVVGLNVGNFFGQASNETTPSDFNVINLTVFIEFGDQPISTLNMSTLQNMVDYCRLHGLNEIAIVYQNQIIINLLKEANQ